MQVGELIEKLSHYDKETDVVLHAGNGDIYDMSTVDFDHVKFKTHYFCDKTQSREPYAIQRHLL